MALHCSSCGSETSDPPDEFPDDWRGLCPECVVKRDVFPLIGPYHKQLLECWMSRDLGGVAIVLGGAEGMADVMTSALKNTILTDAVARKKLREILDLVDEEMPIQKAKVDKPIVRNDPRMG